MSDFTFFFAFVSPLLVLLGWKVVYFNARRIATRSESKSVVDSLIKIINEIADDSVGFWVPKQSLDEPEKYYLSVSAKSSQLQHYINVLNNRGLKLDAGMLSVIADSATLNYENASKMSNSERTLKAHEAVESCMQGVRHIFSQFESTYPPIKEIDMYEFFSWADESHPKSSYKKI